MNREQAKSKIRMSVIVDVKHIDSLKKADEVTDQIFNDHEAQLKALQQHRSCAKCKAFKLDDEHNDGFGQCFWGIHFPNGNSSSYHKGTDFYCSEFEAKEQ